MSKLKIKLMETSIVQNDGSSNVVEVIANQNKPDYVITDVTVLSDKFYHPTIQSILIDLDESHKLNESEVRSKDLTVNILSEAVNQKTGYSYSLFEFESKESVVTMSLTLTESLNRPGLFNVSMYTTKGEKIYECNTVKPKMCIKNLLNNLSNSYLFSEANIVIDPEGKSISDEPKIKIDDYENLEDAINSVLSRDNEDGAEPRPSDVYINKKGNNFKVVDKQSKETVAIVTPEDNVYILRLTDIPEEDAKSLAPDKNEAKAPKELKEIKVKPEELKEADEEVEEVEITEETPSEEKVVEDTDALVLPSAKFIYDPKDLNDLQDKIDRNLSTRATYNILDEITLSNEEYDSFVSDFKQGQPFLQEFRPDKSDATYDVIKVSCENNECPVLLVDPSGTNRAKFITIL